jgi:hypothetical protein
MNFSIFDSSLNNFNEGITAEEVQAAIRIYYWVEEKKYEPIPKTLYVQKYKELLDALHA